jgi:cell division protein FtsW
MDVSIYRLRTRDVLTLCVLALLLLGVVMVQSASAGAAERNAWQWSDSAIKEIIFAAAGLATFLLVGCFNYAALGRTSKTFLRNPIVWLLAIAVLANLIVLVPHIGLQVNGARRWLRLGPIQIQPSELAKWAVVLYLAYCLARRTMDPDRFLRGLLPMLIPIAVLCLFVVVQDFGTAILIALAALTILLAGGVRLRYLLIVIPPVLAAGLWFIMHKQYRWRRITAFENPYAAPQKEGYHMIQSLLSFSSGGWTGRGLGNGIQKLGYLPEDTTDFIFAVICEELGIFGAALTIALYLGVLYCCWQTVKMKADNFGKLLAFGIGTMVTLQAVINIAVATVSVPTKGLSLPLISAGGSGVIITCAALGLLRSAARYKNPPDPIPPATSSGGIAHTRPIHKITPRLWDQFTTT